MGNLTDARLIWLKGGLFFVLGLLSSLLLVLQLRDWRYVVMLVVAVWSFCRAYYFAFYVIQHYVDSSYRFAGLLDFARYAFFGHSPEQQDDGVQSESDVHD